MLRRKRFVSYCFALVLLATMTSMGYVVYRISEDTTYPSVRLKPVEVERRVARDASGQEYIVQIRFTSSGREIVGEPRKIDP
jgi:hypothetical protein